MQESSSVTEEGFEVSKLATRIGAAVTLIYLLLLGNYVYQNWSAVSTLVPNEMGDFLAGAFGPVALLWLVCGYFQQGAELRQNTKALQMQSDSLKQQVEELKVSVSHQAEIADAAKRQLSFEMQKSREATERSEAMSLPELSVIDFNPYAYESGVLFRCWVKNTGAAVNITEVTCTGRLSQNFSGELRTGDRFEVEVRPCRGVMPHLMKNVDLFVKFRDNLGRVGCKEIRFENDSDLLAFRVVT